MTNGSQLKRRSRRYLYRKGQLEEQRGLRLLRSKTHLPNAECANCGEPFHRRHPLHSYCSEMCRSLASVYRRQHRNQCCSENQQNG